MAEYERIGQASDYVRNETLVRAQEDHYVASEPARTSRVKKKVNKTTTFDFGTGPYTVEDILEFAKEIAAYPPGARLGITHGDSQRDGEWFKITITEGS